MDRGMWAEGSEQAMINTRRRARQSDIRPRCFPDTSRWSGPSTLNHPSREQASEAMEGDTKLPHKPLMKWEEHMNELFFSFKQFLNDL